MIPTTSMRTYWFVYLTLVILTLLTCTLSYAPNLGWHGPIGLAIAALKAGLIAVFFMHIWTSDRLPSLALLAGVLWILILFGLTLTDYLTRNALSY